MGVSLPSDLVLDVMRNADPVRLHNATARLQSLEGSDGSNRVFSDALRSTTPDPRDGASAIPQTTAGGGAGSNAYAEFERMVLRNLFESLLPEARSGIFGSGPSAGIWRSLAADQLASIYADSGGIGVASTLAIEEGGNRDGRQPQWPYFTSDEIEAFTG
jgi:hypothetical protein